MTDFGNVTFVNHDGNADAVSIQFRHARIDTDGIAPLAEILFDQLLLEAIKNQAVEHFTFGKADIEQYAEQIFILDCLVARDCYVGDGRTFPDHYDQDVAFTA